MNKKELIENLNNQITFLPDATQGAVRSITTKQLNQTGTKGIVVNTLHLLISPGPVRIQKLGGIHKFMSWDGLVLSDSGGFQVFSLLHTKKWKGKITENGAIFKSPRDGDTHTLTPESVIDIQMKIGADIMVVLDDCRHAAITREEAELSVSNTIKWAERSKRYYEEKYGGSESTGKLLTAVVQGANFRDLREKCAEELMRIGFDGYNFGGYVINPNGNLVVDELKWVYDILPKDHFRYAMGVGKPKDIFEAAQIGYNLFDTVLVTRNARHGSVYSTDLIDESDGLLRLKNSKYGLDKFPIDSSCDCEACLNHSRAYIHQMIKVGMVTGITLATIHNLHFYQKFIEVLNQNISGLSDLSYYDILNQMRNT